MAAKSASTPLWLGGAALLGLTVFAFSQRETLSVAIDEGIDAGLDWARSIVDRVSRHEGGYDALNLNTDGAGLSFGMLQWAQEPGSLGALLEAMHRADPARFLRVFGPDSAALIAQTRLGSLAPVGGARLWEAPWIGRFTLAGRDPVFQAVQQRLAVEGPYFTAALRCAEVMGIRTQRSLALFMDAAVQQGPGAALKIAGRVASYDPGPVASRAELEFKRLEAFVAACAAPFIRGSAPTAPHPKAPRLRWKQIGPSEWHVFAGAFDLYTNIYKRRSEILRDPDLSDAPLHLAGV